LVIVDDDQVSGCRCHGQLALPWRSTNSNALQSANENIMDELQGMRMLVVDDDADNAELLALLLGRAGAAVEVCHTAEAALGVARGRQLDAVLFDVGLPDMDGIALFTRLRETAENGSVVGFAVTGRARDERPELGELGLGYARKPIDSSSLIRDLASCLTQRRVAQSSGQG
jgi:DNA-binding response OmpR family regulator